MQNGIDQNNWTTSIVGVRNHTTGLVFQSDATLIGFAINYDIYVVSLNNGYIVSFEERILSNRCGGQDA
jgi:hypothetical protein